MDGVYALNWNVIPHENNHIFTEIAVNSQSIGNAFAESGTHDDVSYSSVTVVKRLNVGDSVLIRTPAESTLRREEILSASTEAGLRSADGEFFKVIILCYVKWFF